MATLSSIIPPNNLAAVSGTLSAVNGGGGAVSGTGGAGGAGIVILYWTEGY